MGDELWDGRRQNKKGRWVEEVTVEGRGRGGENVTS